MESSRHEMVTGGYVLAGRGSQFTKVQYGTEGYFDAKLGGLEEERGIEAQHIRSRVKHPQTGGRMGMPAKSRSLW